MDINTGEEKELQKLLIDNLTKEKNKVAKSNNREDGRRKSSNTWTPPTKSKNNNRRRSNALRYFLIACILVLVGCGAGIAYYFYNENLKKEHEEKLLAVLTEENYNLRDYEDFIQEYPNSPHRPQLEKRMSELQDMYFEWEKIKATENVVAVKNFCAKYYLPKWEIYTEAQARIEFLNWKNAKNKNTIEAYENYLNQHPDGEHALEATNELDRIKKEEEEKQRLEEERRLKEEQLRKDSLERINQQENSLPDFLNLFD